MLNPVVDRRPIFRIDARDRLVFVNAAWVEFMHPHQQQLADPASFVGRSWWDFVDRGQVRQLWALLHQRVRGIAAPVFVPMRADTPTQRRLIDIELQPQFDGAIQHVCERVWTEVRKPVALLDPAHPRDDRDLRCCAWCKCVQVCIGRWEEIEDAQLLLGIEPAPTLPKLVTDVCTTCKQSLLKTFPARVA
ncbi:MAG TPA: PAS domain-containing protein [Steroidobacteraceae bacterium]|jgi:hypothetical protein|nr:PAS domain-containing protein [Steroidobacteraceae bacterium]